MAPIKAETRDEHGREIRLATPPLPCLVPDGVFDAFAWCASDWLVLRSPTRIRLDDPVGATNPAGMVFVFHDDARASLVAEASDDPRRAPQDTPLARPRIDLPRELASLHAPCAIVGATSWALAPYAIDDATDGLHAQRVRPRDALYLYADGLAALVWGLHDWAHFHNHGPFVERALTELQCDASALVWLWVNRAALGVDASTWERARGSLQAVASARLQDEDEPLDAARVLDATRLVELAAAIRESGAGSRRRASPGP